MLRVVKFRERKRQKKRQRERERERQRDTHRETDIEGERKRHKEMLFSPDAESMCCFCEEGTNGRLFGLRPEVLEDDKEELTGRS